MLCTSGLVEWRANFETRRLGLAVGDVAEVWVEDASAAAFAEEDGDFFLGRLAEDFGVAVGAASSS